jgi:hypothetical protein
MKAILTKALPWTQTKPRRIKAYTEGGNSRTLSYDTCTANGESDREAHLFAAESLACAMNWSTDLIGGGTDEGYAFVFADSDIRSKKRRKS